jgi:exo-beta-1,3-glucanase (GH17 family)
MLTQPISMKTYSYVLVAAVALSTTTLRAELPGYLTEAFRSVRWVAYSPTGGSPDLGATDAKDADKKRDEIRKDLAVLRKAGFGGIVTYGCDGLKGEIPRLAHERGINHIILGVYSPQNEDEINNAKAAAHLVDGYCVGNEGMGGEKRYTLDEVKSRMSELRKWSGKPVTTSEQIGDYLEERVPGLIEAGDWLFPNVHPWFHRQFEEPVASRWTKEQVEKLRAKAKEKGADGKVVICKEVGFPTAGDDEKRASEDAQGDYYVALRVLDVPFVYFEAFDQVWKQHLPIEPHWGLFTKDRMQKKAVAMIMRRPTQNSVQFTSPRLGERLECKLGQDGGIIQVRGTAHGIDKTRVPLLFVFPQDPGVYGWFLQLDPNGVDMHPDGTWIARAQIGNHDFPPPKGMKTNLMIRAVPAEDADKLMDARKQNERLRNTAIRTQDLPKVDQEWVAELKDIELDVK